MVEVGATAGLSGWKAVAYDMTSGAYFDTIPTTVNGLSGYYIKAYVRTVAGANYHDVNLNP